MRYFELLCEDEKVSAEYAHIEQAITDAIEAYGAAPTRSNLEAVWAARKVRDEFQKKNWSSAPEVEEVARPDTYKGEHEAPDHESGSPLYNLTINGGFPEDFYTGKRGDYCHEPGDNKVASIAILLRNRPNHSVKIYRSVPKSAPRKINAGDWVSLNRSYAVQHGRDNLRNDYVIVTKTVYARDLFNDGNLQEWGYDPQPRVVMPPTRKVTEAKKRLTKAEKEAKEAAQLEEWRKKWAAESAARDIVDAFKADVKTHIKQQWLDSNTVWEYIDTPKGKATFAFKNLSHDVVPTVEIHWLLAADRGAGRAAMEIVCDLADKHGVTIQLFALPLEGMQGNLKISQDQLTRFYKSFGFTIEKSPEKKYVFMVRKPHGSVNENEMVDEIWRVEDDGIWPIDQVSHVSKSKFKFGSYRDIDVYIRKTDAKMECLLKHGRVKVGYAILYAEEIGSISGWKMKDVSITDHRYEGQEYGYDFYKYLLDKGVGLTLISDENQTPAGEKVWQKLMSDHDVNVIAVDQNGEETELDPWDDDPANVRLVARSAYL